MTSLSKCILFIYFSLVLVNQDNFMESRRNGSVYVVFKRLPFARISAKKVLIRQPTSLHLHGKSLKLMHWWQTACTATFYPMQDVLLANRVFGMQQLPFCIYILLSCRYIAVCVYCVAVAIVVQLQRTTIG